MSIIKIFVIFFIGLISTHCFSQDIEVHLSVAWTKKLDSKVSGPISHYKIDSIPELLLTYQNVSERDWYMLKAMEAENYQPYLGIEWFGGEVLNSNLIESQQPLFNCIVRKQTPDKWVIAGIHCYMDKDHKSNEKIEQFYNKTMDFISFDSKNSYMFFPNDLLMSSIARNYNNDFIFLRKNSSHIERFSLIGFYLLGGDFKFSLNKNVFRGSVFARPQSFDTPQKRKNGSLTFDGMTILLPDVIIDSYLIYTGKCKSDSVLVHFEPPPS